MPSWEEVVNEVVVSSNYYGLHDASTKWESAFRRMSMLRDCVDQLKKESQSWKGPAADAFRKHLTDTSKDLQDLHDNHAKIVHGLRGATEHLEHAVNSIPVPSWMIDRVKDAQRAYYNGMSLGPFGPGSFEEEFVAKGGSLDSHIPGFKSLAGWMGHHEDKAQKAYDELVHAYDGDVQQIPPGQSTVNPGVNKRDQYGGPDGTGSPGGSSPVPGAGGAGGIPHTKTPGTGDTPHAPGTGVGDNTGTDPDKPHSSYDPYDSSGSGPSDGYGADPASFDDPSTGSGLAGAGGGPGGLGPSTGGLGGVGPQSGGGGAGAGGGPKALPALGPLVHPSDGAGSAGAGHAGGMMGRGMRGGGMGQSEEHETWLTEDDDPWGGDTDAAPSVLA